MGSLGTQNGLVGTVPEMATTQCGPLYCGLPSVVGFLFCCYFVLLFSYRRQLIYSGGSRALFLIRAPCRCGELAGVLCRDVD